MVADGGGAIRAPNQDPVSGRDPLFEPQHLAVAMQEVAFEVEPGQLAEDRPQLDGNVGDAVVREVELREISQVTEVLRLDVGEGGVTEAETAHVFQFGEAAEIDRARRVVLQRQVVRAGVVQERHVRNAVAIQAQTVEGEALEHVPGQHQGAAVVRPGQGAQAVLQGPHPERACRVGRDIGLDNVQVVHPRALKGLRGQLTERRVPLYRQFGQI